MWSTRLTWIFGALFVLFGLPLMFVDNIGTRNLLGGLSTLSLGGFAMAMAYNATATGAIRLQNSTISRAQQPRIFWAAVGLVVIAGFGVITAGVWFMLIKG